MRVNVFFFYDYIEVSVPGTHAFFVRDVETLRPSLTASFFGSRASDSDDSCKKKEFIALKSA